MPHLKALGIKFIAIAVTVFSIFGIFYSANLVNLFWISLLVTGISYVIGDLFILRRYGSAVATIADFALAFLSLWILGGLFLAEGIPIIVLSVLSAFFITCCEPFIHTYLIEQATEKDEAINPDLRDPNRLQTEFSEEIDVDTNKDKKDRTDR